MLARMKNSIGLEPNLHLSVVAVTRNDDHGGDLRGRTQHFVDGFIAQCRRHHLAAELILVEWNPPPDRPPLEESLQWPADFGPASVRIVTVPPEVHATFPHSANLPLFQMIGKNVGIRRARGNYILATNIDILFDDAIVRYMRDKLSPGIVLRVDRYDVPSDLPKGAPFELILTDCAKRFFQVNTRFGTFDRDSRRFLGMGGSLEASLLASYFDIKLFGVANTLKQVGQRTNAFMLSGALATARFIANTLKHAVQRTWASMLSGASSVARGIANHIVATVSFLKTMADLILHTPAFVYRRILKISPLNTMPSRLYWLVRRNLRRVASLVRRIIRFAAARLHSILVRLRSAVAKAQRTLGSLWRLLSRSNAALQSAVLKARRLLGSLWRSLSRTNAVHVMEKSRWLHTNACGDFTLLARDDWFRLRGYPEWPIFSWHLDSVLLYAAHAQGLREVALGPAYRTYHIDHSVGSGWSLAGHNQLFARLDAKAVPYLSNEKLRHWQQTFAADPKSAIVNDLSWGLETQILPERDIFPNDGKTPIRKSKKSRLSSVNV